MRMHAAAAGLALLSVTPAFAQETVYAVTFNDLVLVDLDDASQSVVIGPHGLPVSTRADGKQFGAFSITCAEGRLLGLYYDLDSSGNFDQYLVEYDKDTGDADILTLVASSDIEGYVEAIEWHDGLDALVVSMTPSLASGSFPSSLFTLEEDGDTNFLVDNNRDNDYAAYDSSRDRFYVIDPNQVGRVTRVNLDNGNNTDLGVTTPTTADMAYSCERDEIYSYDVATDELISFGTGNEDEAIWLGVFGLGDVVQGLAICCDDEDRCLADLDGDGDADYWDFWIFTWAYWKHKDIADINGDGRVNHEDVWAFFDAYDDCYHGGHHGGCWW